MRRARFLVWLSLSMAAASACGSDDSGRAPPVQSGDDDDDTAGSGSGAGKSSTAGSGAQSDAGQGASAEGGAPSNGGRGDQGGAAGDGITYESAGTPAMIPGVCDAELMLGSEQPVELTTDVTAPKLLSMTPDELTIAFVTTGAPDPVLYVADRASTDDEFAPLAVTLPEGYEADSGVSLASDGRSLILVRSDHAGFGAISRSARGQAFGAAADTSPFAFINSAKPMSGRDLGWPVLSSDGATLYFVSYFGQARVVQSTKGQNGVFDLGQETDEFTLGGEEGEYKYINGISTDQRAMFYLDEASGHAMAIFRSRPGGPFYFPIDLGERQGIVPNGDCNRAYSSADGALVIQPLK